MSRKVILYIAQSLDGCIADPHGKVDWLDEAPAEDAGYAAFAKTIDTVGGQVDIMPTIANLMNVETGQPFVFGHDLLNADEGFVAQISYIGKGSFITGDNNMLFGIGKDSTVESGSLWDLRDGSRMNLNISLCQQYSDRANALIDTCKKVLDYNLIADYVTH